ncbi:MAG: hypothetical protein ACT4RN_23495 [Pseudonocardia sp.]
MSLIAGTVALAVAAGAFAFGTAAAAPDGPRLITVNMRGTAPNTSTDPARQVFEFDLFSVETGEKIGTATDDVACKTDELPGCPLFDAITTFHLPDGDLTNRATVSVSPDPARPGWVLNGAFPAPGEQTIVGGTGAYEGATGQARLSGANDARGFPLSLTGDDIFVIELDR